MNYTQLINIVKGVSLSSRWVEEFHNGDIYEHLNAGSHRYGNVTLTVDSVSMDGDMCNVNCSLFYTDRLLSDGSNTASVQTMAINVLRDIAGRISEGYPITISNQVFNPFTESFADLCAGCFMTCTISYPADSDCSEEFEVRSLTITNNGVYEVLGYDKAVVNVVTPTQVKSATYAENGSYEVNPDTGYYMSKVNVTVDAPALRPKTLVEVTSAWITAMIQRVINS